MVEHSIEKPIPEEIARHFSAAMDSVALIIELNKKDTLTDEEKDTLARNKEHIRIMIARGWFSNEQELETLQSVL